jgi:anti-sigma-K factor RskA
VTRPHDDSMLELASLYGIDALETDEAAIAREHIVECEICRTEYARAKAAGTALALSAASPAPAELRDRVLHSAVVVRRVRRPWYGSPFVIGTAAAAIIVGFGTTWMLNRPPQTQAERWAATCTGLFQSACGGVIVSDAASVRLHSYGLPRLPNGKVYQAWILRGTNPPIAEPTFRLDAKGRGDVTLADRVQTGDTVAVTAEPEGGTSAPTSRVVMAAKID